jgi:hypothetical protein
MRPVSAPGVSLYYLLSAYGQNDDDPDRTVTAGAARASCTTTPYSARRDREALRATTCMSGRAKCITLARCRWKRCQTLGVSDLLPASVRCP